MTVANSDTTKGSFKDAKGDLKKAVGEVTGDRQLKDEGNADKAEGKIQKGIGKLRDVVRGKDV
jgi:uncharacterized protein YjbJ (UPF0337 family)